MTKMMVAIGLLAGFALYDPPLALWLLRSDGGVVNLWIKSIAGHYSPFPNLDRR